MSLFLALSLILRILGVFVVNFEHILHLGRREKCRSTCFILEKRKKSKFNRLQIELFFPPNISSSPCIEARTPNIGRITGFYGILVLRGLRTCAKTLHTMAFLLILLLFFKKKTFSWDFFVNEIGQKLNKFLKT